MQLDHMTDGPGDARHGTGPAAVRRLHDGHRPAPPAGHDDRGGRGHRAAAARGGRQPRRPTGSPSTRRGCSCARSPATASRWRWRRPPRPPVPPSPGAWACRCCRCPPPTRAGFDALDANWGHFERISGEHGNPVDRESVARRRVDAPGRDPRAGRGGRWSTACSPCAATSRGWARRKLPWTGSAARGPHALDDQRLPDLRRRHRRHARRRHRHDRAADGQDRRLRHVPLPRPQLRRLAGDATVLRAVRRARDPGLPTA